MSYDFRIDELEEEEFNKIHSRFFRKDGKSYLIPLFYQPMDIQVIEITFPFGKINSFEYRWNWHIIKNEGLEWEFVIKNAKKRGETMITKPFACDLTLRGGYHFGEATVRFRFNKDISGKLHAELINEDEFLEFVGRKESRVFKIPEIRESGSGELTKAAK